MIASIGKPSFVLAHPAALAESALCPGMLDREPTTGLECGPSVGHFTAVLEAVPVAHCLLYQIYEIGSRARRSLRSACDSSSPRVPSSDLMPHPSDQQRRKDVDIDLQRLCSVKTNNAHGPPRRSLSRPRWSEHNQHERRHTPSF